MQPSQKNLLNHFHYPQCSSTSIATILSCNGFDWVPHLVLYHYCFSATKWRKWPGACLYGDSMVVFCWIQYYLWNSLCKNSPSLQYVYECCEGKGWCWHSQECSHSPRNCISDWGRPFDWCFHTCCMDSKFLCICSNWNSVFAASEFSQLSFVLVVVLFLGAGPVILGAKCYQHRPIWSSVGIWRTLYIWQLGRLCRHDCFSALVVTWSGMLDVLRYVSFLFSYRRWLPCIPL